MTYDQLVAFLAVASEGSFTAASALLHKSQPAVSKLVKNLEEELGLALFDRAQYRATLTAAGRLFSERAAAVIESTEALKSFGMELAGGVEPVVRLAVEAVTPLAPVMEILRAMERQYPSVRIELSTERLAGAADALREDRADIAIATLIGMDAARLDVARFRRVRIVPVARGDHALARRGTRVPARMLRAHAQIVLRDSTLGHDSPSLNVLEGGLRWSVTDIAAKKEVILAGMGWGGLPEHVVAEALASGELIALDVPEFATDAMELFVLRRRDRPHGVAAGALWERLVQSGSENGKPAARRTSKKRRARRTRRHIG
ncbi:MAG TPA: LysR family transcriptional regulator [Myxococcota bacterium]|nr:LysR family transcriptional regulator [Myxococcota bacterium]